MLTPADVEVRPVARVLTRAEADHLAGLAVTEMDVAMPTAEPCLLLDEVTAAPVLAYLPMDDPAMLRQAVLATPMTETYRAGTGITNISRTFGMSPRKPVQWREGCAPTSLARDEPAVMAVLTHYAQQFRDQLAALLPATVADGHKAVSVVLPEWRLAEDALWTSGVINRSSALPYHRDRFNFDAWSAMPVLRRGVRGGYLAIPEYGLVLPCRDGWTLYFSGYQHLHGVTPMTKIKDDGYRYSVVYYALKGMKDCFTAAVESATAAVKRTEREVPAHKVPR